MRVWVLLTLLGFDFNRPRRRRSLALPLCLQGGWQDFHRVPLARDVRMGHLVPGESFCRVRVPLTLLGFDFGLPAS
jgi:hypothetical protein